MNNHATLTETHLIELDQLQKSYPLPTGWRLKDSFFDICSAAASLDLSLAGLVAEADSGAVVTGSAAGEGPYPVLRAYMELIERISVMTAPVHDEASAGNWRKAKSNGVGAHVTFAQASEAAALELVERDRILRSWWGEVRPQRVESAAGSRWQECLSGLYDFGTWSFPVEGESIVVVGVFAFPKANQTPLVYGFGAGVDANSALLSAEKECKQRLGFLWGESLPEELPEFAPTPNFHQETFLHKDGIRRLTRWLAGDHTEYANGLSRGPLDFDHMTFLDITPPNLQGLLYIVKASSRDAVPLIFGKDYGSLPRNLPPELVIHPIA